MTNMPLPETHNYAVLSIDLAALAANYRLLKQRVYPGDCAGVVKANGYGLGAEPVARTLYEAGCRTFFVAQLDEGIELRKALGEVDIHILGGFTPGTGNIFKQNKLIPVLGSLGEIAAWKSYCTDQPLACDIHVDTGMLRLGLPPDELEAVAASPDLVAGLEIKYVMSHLASADIPHSPQTGAQLKSFRDARKILPQGKASFANSSGIFWGDKYHFDLARPGVALYGVNPTPNAPNPMQPVVSLQARIVQIRNASPGETVGYGAAHKVEGKARIATLGVGYADGYLRSLSGRASGYIKGQKVPLVGRVSMDLITFDVSSVPPERCQVGDWIELIGNHHSVDELAMEARTIGYEVLTSLGSRYHRVYKN